MSRRPDFDDVADELLESILATPKRQRRLLSKTLWNKFGYRVRTKERVEQVQAALRDRGILLTLDDGILGVEQKDDWIILSYVEPKPGNVQGDVTGIGESVPMPDAAWFDLMANRKFESEREVEYYFIMPLLEQLGFIEADFAIGYPVEMFEGVKKVKKEADLVVFDGVSREEALLVVEAKRMNRPLTDDVIGQAKAYSLWLRTPYYLLTNGVDIRLYHFRGPWQSDVLLMTLTRSELKDHWGELYRCLNKTAVVAFKQRLKEQIANSVENAGGIAAAPLP